MGALYLALSGRRTAPSSASSRRSCRTWRTREYLQRFRDEAKVVVRLSHGNLVPVFDSGQAGGENLSGDGLRRGARSARHLEPLREEGDRLPGRRSPRTWRARWPAASTTRTTSATSSWSTGTSRLTNVLLSYSGENPADRLRAGLVHPEDRKDRARHHLRQGQLHVARAGARREDRRPHRPLRHRDHPLGAAHRPAALSVGARAGGGQGSTHLRGAPAPRAESGAGRAIEARRARTGRARSDHPQGAGARSQGSLRQPARTCGTIWPSSWRRPRPPPTPPGWPSSSPSSTTKTSPASAPNASS